jgi:hypothetical protein
VLTLGQPSTQPKVRGANPTLRVGQVYRWHNGAETEITFLVTRRLTLSSGDQVSVCRTLDVATTLNVDSIAVEWTAPYVVERKAVPLW